MNNPTTEKSAEEYLLQYMRMIGVSERVIANPSEEDTRHRNESIEFFRSIQRNSKHAAMLEAAEIARELNDGHEWPVTRAILTAAEKYKD